MTIQQEILKINANKNLSAAEKNVKIQKLMSKNIKVESNLNKHCSHYEKKCHQFSFTCCSIYDPCVRCHQERKICSDISLEKVTCDNCNLQQTPSSSCIGCNTVFGDYSCLICNIWTNKKDTFHCSKCGICRRGTRETTTHCDDCNMCFFNNQGISHICKSKNYQENCCSICHENLFSTQQEYISLLCSHYIHKDCFYKAIEHNNYKCPQCKKSMINMSEHWKLLDNLVEQHPVSRDMIPLEKNDMIDTKFGIFKINSIENEILSGDFVDWNAHGQLWKNSESVYPSKFIEIYCNDCMKKSLSLYHFYGTKCSHCHGYNTQK